MMKLLAIICVFVFALFACREKTDLLTFGRCTESVLTDSLLLRSKLMGSWKWTEQYCPCCQNSKPTIADKEVIASFLSDTTFSVKENQQIVITGSWKIQKASNGYAVSIHKQGAVDYFYLDGSITICGSQLTADMTPFDGCEHLFVKM